MAITMGLLWLDTHFAVDGPSSTIQPVTQPQQQRDTVRNGAHSMVCVPPAVATVTTCNRTKLNVIITYNACLMSHALDQAASA
jgi:hypothetical protein